MKSNELSTRHHSWLLLQHSSINKPILKRVKSFITNNALFLLIIINLLPVSSIAQKEKLSKNQEIKVFIKKQSLVMAKRAEDWAKDKTGDILLNGVKDFLQQNKLDQNTAGKILSSMARNKKALEQIYDGATEMDIQGAALSTQLLMGKIIAENVPESKMAGLLNDLTKYPDVAAETSQALGSFAGGDYYKTSETIGRLIWKRTAIGKTINVAINVEKAGWDFLIQNQYDAAYQKYKEQGTEGLVRLFTGPAAYVREKYFQGRSVGDEVIASKMAELFEAASRQENAAVAEQTKLERMYAMFQQMENTGGVIFDLRKHWEQNGVNSESEVFNNFLWLSRSIRRDLLSVGLDSWQLGKTLNGGNPAFSPEALSLLIAFSQGGLPAYKDKFAAIARTRFPKRVIKSDIVKANEFSIRLFFDEKVSVPWSSGVPLFFNRSKGNVIKQDDMKWNGGHFTRTMKYTWRAPDGWCTGNFSLVIEGDVDPAGTRLISLKALRHSEEKFYKGNDFKIVRRMDIETTEIELHDFDLKLAGKLSWEGWIDSKALSGHLVKYRTLGSHKNYEDDKQTETWDVVVPIAAIQRAGVFLFFDPVGKVSLSSQH